MTYEQELAYLADVVESPCRDWLAVTDALGSDYNPDSIRKAYACTKYGGYAVYKYFMSKPENTSSEEERLRMEELQDTFYKERIKYADKLREYRNKLREESRFENLKDTMVDVLMEAEQFPIEIKPYVDYTTKASRTGMLVLSDIHYGLEVNNQVNFYNVEVARERLYKIANRAIQICREQSIPQLNICLLGDIVNGIINISNRIEQEEDIMTQIIESGKLLSEVISYIASNVSSVSVYTVWGNHARIPSANASKKSDMVNRENLERLIYHYIKTVLPDEIKVITSMNDDYLYVTIGGRKVLLEHGDKGSKTNPVLDYVTILGDKPDLILRGHYHTYSSVNVNNTVVITNGSLIGTDNYALSIRQHTKASQTMVVLDAEYPLDTQSYELVVD